MIFFCQKRVASKSGLCFFIHKFISIDKRNLAIIEWREFYPLATLVKITRFRVVVSSFVGRLLVNFNFNFFLPMAALATTRNLIIFYQCSNRVRSEHKQNKAKRREERLIVASR